MTGRQAVVVGASSDIGRAVCGRLAALGYAVTGTYRDPGRAELVAAACAPAGHRPRLVQLDVTNREEERLAAEVAGGAPLGVLVYAAGTVDPAPVPQLSEAQWDRVLDVTVSAAYRAVRALLPLFGDEGAVAFIGSTAHRQGTGPAAYVSAKAALRGLAKALARELARQRIRVNVVEPGFVDTRFEGVDEAAERRRRQLRAMIPAGRLATADEVAEIVVLAVGHPYLTGATLTVAGGAVMD